MFLKAAFKTILYIYTASKGLPGAENSWKAYCKGMSNLYIFKQTKLHQELVKGGVSLGGQVIGNDLQRQVYPKIEVRQKKYVQLNTTI